MKTNAMRSRSADTAQKVKALTDKLEAGVKEVFESEQYIAHMNTGTQIAAGQFCQVHQAAPQPL